MSNFFVYNSGEKEEPVILRLYSKANERIRLMFCPLKMMDRDPEWEDWNSYKFPLEIYITDYDKLLIPYFNRLFPVSDPISAENQEYFDVCFDNWIGRSDWIRFMDMIKNDLEQKSEDEKTFYMKLSDWIDTALEETDVIVVVGNQ